MEQKDIDGVMAGIEKGSQLLRQIASVAADASRESQSLSEVLQKYRSTFEQLVKNNLEIVSLKQGMNKASDELLATSNLATEKVDSLAAMAFLQGSEVDPANNSTIVSIKGILAGVSELALAVNRDLLLENSEGTYLKRFEEVGSRLSKESKNVSSMARAIKDADVKSYPDHMGRLVPRIVEASGKIHRLWQDNRSLVAQMDGARGEVVAKNRAMAASMEDGLKAIKHNGMVFNLISLGVASLVLIIGGGGIGRSITKPIEKVIAQLREGAERTASAAEQVSSASQAMAEGSSEQAASLEETSSSLEEMASMTKNNAHNAGGSDALMKEIGKIVEQSNQSMVQLTASMEDISKCSEETRKIVKTIDEIAFQTNLLALNAAVEAARAGEAGAGFAVVADEVRNLAMRAADAAKSTAELIEKTVKGVKEGASVATRTYDEFARAAAGINKAAALIGEIALASDEQAQGVGQINKAVAEMDRVTQQNAANAEESASASRELEAQADRMKGFVKDLVALVGGTNHAGRAEDGPPSRVGRSSKQVQKAGKTIVPGLRIDGKGARPRGGIAQSRDASHGVRPENLIPFDDEENRV